MCFMRLASVCYRLFHVMSMPVCNTLLVVVARSVSFMVGVLITEPYQDPQAKREVEYRIPRLHYPVNSRRFPETFGDFCRNETSFL